MKRATRSAHLFRDGPRDPSGRDFELDAAVELAEPVVRMIATDVFPLCAARAAYRFEFLEGVFHGSGGC